MTQYYRNQNESGRWQDSSRSGRSAENRDRGERSGRHETGNEQRYSPDWGDRPYEAGQFEDNSRGFEGDRSYAAGGYSEEFGHRRDSYSPYGNNNRFNEQSGREPDRFSGSYGSPAGRFGRHEDSGIRDSGRGGWLRHDPYGSEDFNRGRGGYQGSGMGSGMGMGQRFGSSGTMQPQYGGYGNFDRDFEHTRSGGNAQAGQSHRGRGPKGYERSDERLKEIICERLTDDPSIDASEVTVEVSNKVVKLTGNVEDRRIKYLIEDVIEQAGGVRDIDNQLRHLMDRRVRTPATPAAMATTSLAPRARRRQPRPA
jgi:hypothetical protein